MSKVRAFTIMELCDSQDFSHEEMENTKWIEKSVADKLANAKSCPCGDVGYFVVTDYGTGEPAQEQCEFCYTDENSRFKALEEYRDEK